MQKSDFQPCGNDAQVTPQATSRKHYILVKDVAPWCDKKQCLDIPNHLVMGEPRRQALKTVFMQKGPCLGMTPVVLHRDLNVDISSVKIFFPHLVIECLYTDVLTHTPIM